MIVVVTGLPRSGTSLMMQMLKGGGLAVLTDNEREADVHNPRGYYADSAYGRKGLPAFIQQTLGIVIELVRRPKDMEGFHVLRKRWIVERTFAWIGRCRRHSKDYERNPETSETMIYISMVHLMTKRLARANS